MVAFGAYYGIRKSVENNQNAIDASNEREVEKWRRETLIRLSEEASTAQRDIDRRYNREAITTTEKWNVYQDAVWMSTRKLGSLADSFTILGADHLSERCLRLQRVAYAVAEPAKILRNQALGNADTQLENLPGWGNYRRALDALSKAREELIVAAAKLIKVPVKPG